MTLIIFIVGLIVSSAVVYALFAYTIHEMKTGDRTSEKTSNAPIKLIKQIIK